MNHGLDCEGDGENAENMTMMFSNFDAIFDRDEREDGLRVKVVSRIAGTYYISIQGDRIRELAATIQDTPLISKIPCPYLCQVDSFVCTPSS